MGRINIARVLLGGLLAGFIINLFEYVTNGVVFAAWDAYEKAVGRQMRPGAIPFFIISAFVAGIGVVWSKDPGEDRALSYSHWKTI